jgi:hypothetical protein
MKGVPLTQIIKKDPETPTPRNASADPKVKAKETIRKVTNLDHHDTFSPTNDMHGGERKNEECNS